MTRLTHRIAILALSGIMLAGCGVGRSAPTRLAPSATTTIGVNSYCGAPRSTLCRSHLCLARIRAAG